MALEIEPFLIAVGLMIGAAFIGTLVFHRFRLPDIILLIAVGVILGPVTGFVDIETFLAIAPLVSTIAIIIILFDGGLKIRFEDILGGVASGSLLGFLVFVATALLCGLVAHLVIGLPWDLSILLGMSLGGAGVVIVIPLIQQMGVGERAKTVVSIEAATSDVLVVIGVVGYATALSLQRTDPSSLAQQLVQTFAVGLALGALAGLAWVQALRRFAQRSYEYVLTMAALFLVYSVSELLRGSGALAVLAFGLIIGNSQKKLKVEPLAGAPKKRHSWTYAPVFGVDLQNLHHEMVFFIRAFFFVALGVVMNLAVLYNTRFLMGGFLLSLAVIASRFWGVQLIFGRKRLEPWDRLAVTLMFPLGLAAAALSIVPHERFGLPGTEDFGSYAAVVIVLTNLLAAAAVYVLSRPAVRSRIVGAPKDDDEDSERRSESSRGRPWSID